ncbi:hypothetical protein C8F04DRAFT_1042044 [Mycena alexandri]|uniref:MULE transposase domain-containing protein n=1 Tax=Mycena alexandri TaxID=1745969 RepID=A0AAD6SN29_9AGAR|nr:hypothetical protein C8F04DRAFT_1042044 [Mycena alexandri]
MDARKCGKCHKLKLVTVENWKAVFRGGGLQTASNCRDCSERDRARRQEKNKGNNPNKENVTTDASTERERDDDASDFLGVDPISLDAFRSVLEAAGDINVFCAHVDMSELVDEGTEDLRASIDALAEIVWEKIGYRFLYHATHSYKNSDDCRYAYHCAQLESRRHISKKNPDAAKQRDKGSMEMFDCGGWLNIWASPGETNCYVRIRHGDCHQKYVCIDILDDQLWNEILKTYPRPKFSQKSVYNQWFKQQQGNWRRCDDEFESAKILLQEFTADPAHKLEPIPLPQSDGFRALGFVFPSVLEKWEGVIREVALDSTFQTNKAGFECFALLGEVGGSGVPLGFLLLKSNQPELNEKEQYIRATINFITVVWKIRVMQALSDKEITEINALLAELPDDIKYQLCFWHCIRAIKTRLSILGRHPAHYDAEAAFEEFDWINREFIPINQMPQELRTEVLAMQNLSLGLTNVLYRNILTLLRPLFPPSNFVLPDKPPRSLHHPAQKLLYVSTVASSAHQTPTTP